MKIVKIKYPRNKADKFFRKFKKVLYIVSKNGFGTSKVGEIRESYLINSEGHIGLIYHPSDTYGCGCFELVIKNNQNKYWRSKDNNSWINYMDFGI